MHLLQLLRRQNPMILPQRHLAFRKRKHAAARGDLGRLVQDLRLTPLADLLPTARNQGQLDLGGFHKRDKRT